jgi:energy-coupling factor transporter ATP-binding protein EcfA2
MNDRIIGICGPARSGKDTLADSFAEIFKEYKVKTQKLSFAKELKYECKSFVKRTLGIDIFTEVTEEKDIIRPLLVTWGTHVRRKLNDNVWIDALEKRMHSNKIVIISDVRFENEFNWVKKQGGKIIFVNRTLPDGSLVPNANEEEEKNNCFLQQNADSTFTWDTISDSRWIQAISHSILTGIVPKDWINRGL